MVEIIFSHHLAICSCILAIHTFLVHKLIANGERRGVCGRVQEVCHTRHVGSHGDRLPRVGPWLRPQRRWGRGVRGAPGAELPGHGPGRGGRGGQDDLPRRLARRPRRCARARRARLSRRTTTSRHRWSWLSTCGAG